MSKIKKPTLFPVVPGTKKMLMHFYNWNNTTVDWVEAFEFEDFLFLDHIDCHINGIFKDSSGNEWKVFHSALLNTLLLMTKGKVPSMKWRTVKRGGSYGIIPSE